MAKKIFFFGPLLVVLLLIKTSGGETQFEFAAYDFLK